MKNKKTRNSLSIILILIIIAIGVLLGYKYVNEQRLSEPTNEITNVESDEEDNVLVVKEKEVQIFNGNERTIAVMIDNHSDACPQANLNKAYLVY